MTDLDTLRRDNFAYSWLSALSADGKTAGGVSYNNDLGTRQAFILNADDNWQNWQIKYLGSLKTDNYVQSRLYWQSELMALSADGNVAGGWAYNSLGEYHAVIWYFDSDNHWRIKDLGTLKSDNSGFSQLMALSDDGKIAVGWAQNDSKNYRAVIWFFDDNNHWQIKDVGTLKSDNSGESIIEALSADGKIAVGWAEDDSGNKRRVIWHGDDWQIKKDVGPLENYDEHRYKNLKELAAARTLAIEFSDIDFEIPKSNAISQIPESVPETPAENAENPDPPQNPNHNASEFSSFDGTDTIDTSLVDGVESNHEHQEQIPETGLFKSYQPQPLEMKIKQIQREREELKRERDDLERERKELKNERDELRKEMNQLKEEMKKLKGKLSDLKHVIALLMSKYDAR